jgi:hypothetical protein
VGLVAGATDIRALKMVRETAPDIWILCPGVGAQVYISVYYCLYMYVYTIFNVNVYIFVDIYVCMYMYVCMQCICMCIYTCFWILWVVRKIAPDIWILCPGVGAQVCISVYYCLYMYVYTIFGCKCMYLCRYIHVHVHVVSMYVYIYMFLGPTGWSEKSPRIFGFYVLT